MEGWQSCETIARGPGIGLAYRDALSLAIRARACFERGVNCSKMSASDRSLYTIETMRISTCILHVMAWSMHHKAYEAGEIDRDELMAPENRLGDEAVCLASPASDIERLPDWVGDMLDQSIRLYARASRLQDMLDRTPSHFI